VRRKKSEKMGKLFVLYEIVNDITKISDDISSSYPSYNGFNSFLLNDVDLEKEILLIDVLTFLQSNKAIQRAFGNNFEFYTEYRNRLLPLSSPSSVIPLKSKDMIVIFLEPSSSPLIPLHQLHLFQDHSRNKLTNKERTPISPFMHGNMEREPPYRDDHSAPYEEQFPRPSSSQYSSNPSSQSQSAQGGSFNVTDLSDAAEVGFSIVLFRSGFLPSVFSLNFLSFVLFLSVIGC
jgi:hypothetical protein